MLSRGRHHLLIFVNRLFLHGAEIFLAYTASGAYPILGQILESCSGLNTIVRVSFSGVIDVAAYIAFVLFHVVLCFK